MNPYLPLPKAPILAGRQRIVLEHCRGKRVLHIGCVDAGLMEERLVKGELMHQRLAEVAADLWGVDVDAAGIQFLRNRGFGQLLVGDAAYLNEVTELRGVEFDVIVATEVVEHLQNPGAFFQAVRTLMQPGRTEFIVTVPNAFRVDTLLWLLRGVELNHPDHNYWFSYRTITNLFVKNGFVVEQVMTYSFQPRLVMPNRLRRLLGKPPVARSTATLADGRVGPPGTTGWQRAGAYLRSLPKRVLVSFLYSRSSFWADGLIVVARLAEANAHPHG